MGGGRGCDAVRGQCGGGTGNHTGRNPTTYADDRRIDGPRGWNPDGITSRGNLHGGTYQKPTLL